MRARSSGFWLTAALVLLAACGPRTEPFEVAPRPSADSYGEAVPAGHTAYDNQSLADLFVRLTHGLENGDERRGLQRFEQAINVGMIGPGTEQYRAFLDDFLGEIAERSQIDISAGTPPHNLLIRFVPGEEYLPKTSNQCVVIFGQPTWQDFLADPLRYSGKVTQEIDRQTEMGVIIPDTIEPHKVRECLLEEITQALGPANDLYGLPSSIFNDDNAHTWPTRIDYLMLRVLYDPRLTSDLSKEDSGRIALEILSEINPQGIGAPPLSAIRQKEFGTIRARLHELVAPGIPEAHQLAKVRYVSRVAAKKFPDSAYQCTVATALAQIADGTEQDDAGAQYQRAIDLCSRVHGPDDIRVASLRLDRALHDFGNDRDSEARDEAETLLPIFIAHGLDDKIAGASVLRVAAAFRLNDPSWEDEYLDHAAAWSAYAYGDDNDLTQKLRR